MIDIKREPTDDGDSRPRRERVDLEMRGNVGADGRVAAAVVQAVLDLKSHGDFSGRPLSVFTCTIGRSTMSIEVGIPIAVDDEVAFLREVRERMTEIAESARKYARLAPTPE